MTRSASQRYTERQKKIRRTQEEERAVASPPPSRSSVGSMIRFARAYEFSPHHTGGVFASCVFHSHQKCVRSRRHFSFDHVTILRQTTRRARIKRERSGLRDFSRREGFHQADYVFQTGSHQKSGMARRARRRGMWIVTVSFHFAVCAFVSDTRLLETS